MPSKTDRTGGYRYAKIEEDGSHESVYFQSTHDADPT